jgi:hypothetical protein
LTYRSRWAQVGFARVEAYVPRDHPNMVGVVPLIFCSLGERVRICYLSSTVGSWKASELPPTPVLRLPGPSGQVFHRKKSHCYGQTRDRESMCQNTQRGQGNHWNQTLGLFFLFQSLSARLLDVAEKRGETDSAFSTYQGFVFIVASAPSEMVASNIKRSRNLSEPNY